MNEMLFATLILMSSTGSAMVKASEFLSMKDCERAAQGIRVFHSGGEYQNNRPVIAICVPSFIGDEQAK